MIIIKEIKYGTYFIPKNTVFKQFLGYARYNSGNYADPSSWEIHCYSFESEKDKTFKEIVEDLAEKAGCDTIYLAQAYEVTGLFLFSKEPVELKEKEDVLGPGFNYGSCNLISVNEPGFVLILAQND